MPEPARTRISSRLASAGVALLVLACAMPAEWHPAFPLFIGLALIAISHVLTPCRDQITRWWRSRITRQ